MNSICIRFYSIYIVNTMTRNRHHKLLTNGAKKTIKTHGFALDGRSIKIDTAIVKNVDIKSINQIINSGTSGQDLSKYSLCFEEDSDHPIQIDDVLLNTMQIHVNADLLQEEMPKMLARIAAGSNYHVIKNLSITSHFGIFHRFCDLSASDFPSGLQKITFTCRCRSFFQPNASGLNHLFCEDTTLVNFIVSPKSIPSHVKRLKLTCCEFHIKSIPHSVHEFVSDGVPTQIPKIYCRRCDELLIIESGTVSISPDDCRGIKELHFTDDNGYEKIFFEDGIYPQSLTIIELSYRCRQYDLSFLENVPTNFITLRVDIALVDNLITLNIPDSINTYHVTSHWQQISFGNTCMIFPSHIESLELVNITPPEFTFAEGLKKIHIKYNGYIFRNVNKKIHLYNFQEVLISDNGRFNNYHIENSEKISMACCHVIYTVHNVRSITTNKSHYPENITECNTESIIDTMPTIPILQKFMQYASKNLLYYRANDYYLSNKLHANPQPICHDFQQYGCCPDRMEYIRQWSPQNHIVFPSMVNDAVMTLLLLRNTESIVCLMPNELLFVLFDLIAIKYITKYQNTCCWCELD